MKQHIGIHKAIPNQGALDFSYLLDAPAGKHGFVQAKNGHFYFENGQRARFLGFNVATRSNTPDHETAERLAERFASMGVNIIRLHAADAPIGEKPCSWSSCKEAPLLDYVNGTTRSFHKEGLDRFDYFVAKLKEKGIYLHIDLIVARDFQPADGLDHPGHLGPCLKVMCMINERLIELQEEYAKELLCHVNPYTGLALIDDPAVVTIQLNNEDTAIKGIMEFIGDPLVEPYVQEVKERWNQFLLMKYHNRQGLKKAWTSPDGVCALHDHEDPLTNTVDVVNGSFYQVVSEPMGEWDSPVGPARYADYMEFGALMNRKFYKRMKDYVISLGAKVPIVASNLIAGAADVYGHTDGDLMENNCYFNHPMFPIDDSRYLAMPMEYVACNPLTMQYGAGAMSTSLISLASIAIVNGKPFMLSEWNEYGLEPFHSTAFVHTVAYASLNDWDGLIVYNHHTSENWDDQPADEIKSVFDAYNDPSLICQWGFMATVFLKGLISPSQNRVDVVYTQNDWKTLPNFNAMPMCTVPYMTRMRNVFLDGSENYQGDAQAAINAGFLNGCNLEDAKHGIYYAWSPYRDPYRRALDPNRLKRAAKNSRELMEGVHLSEKNLVFDEIQKVANNGDYRQFATLFTQAMQEWGIFPEGTGYVDGKLISDTGEIMFDPEQKQFQVHNDACGYFSGAPTERISLSDSICVDVKNERITLALLPAEGEDLNNSKIYLLTAMGKTGMDDIKYEEGPEFMPGYRFQAIILGGKLYAETLEGTIFVKAEQATLRMLSPIGEVLSEYNGEKTKDGVQFVLDGSVASVNYQLILK